MWICQVNKEILWFNFFLKSIITNCANRLHVVEVEAKKILSNFLVTRCVTENVHFRKRSFHPSFTDKTIIRTVLKFRTEGNHEIII